MRRDLLLVLIALTSLALLGVIIADWWAGGSTRGALGESRETFSATASSANEVLAQRPSHDRVEDVRPPEIRLVSDRQAYAEWFRQHRHEPDLDARSPEGVDFSAHQVLLVLWGDKPGAGHTLRVERIEARGGETLVTIVTRAPEWVENPAIVYPGLTVALPKGRPVRVVITGERMRPVPIFADFQPLRSLDLEVEVEPHRPVRDGS